VRLKAEHWSHLGPRSGVHLFPLGPFLETAVAGVPTLAAVLLIRTGLRRYEVPEGYRSRVLFRVLLVSLCSSIAVANMCLWSVAYTAL
ncbi:MAG: hypothetical protein ACYSU0_23625, partial [Planctomycetota bacterium]